MDVRRVVTGHDAAGKAVFVSDERVSPVRPSLLAGTEFHQLWGADATPRFPDDGALPDHSGYFPPVGGFRFGFFTLPPDDGRGVPADLDVPAALGELEELLPGLAGHMEPADPGIAHDRDRRLRGGAVGRGGARARRRRHRAPGARRHGRAERHSPPVVQPGRRTRGGSGVHHRRAARPPARTRLIPVRSRRPGRDEAIALCGLLERDDRPGVVLPGVSGDACSSQNISRYTDLAPRPVGDALAALYGLAAATKLSSTGWRSTAACSVSRLSRGSDRSCTR